MNLPQLKSPLRQMKMVKMIIHSWMYAWSLSLLSGRGSNEESNGEELLNLDGFCSETIQSLGAGDVRIHVLQVCVGK